MFNQSSTIVRLRNPKLGWCARFRLDEIRRVTKTDHGSLHYLDIDLVDGGQMALRYDQDEAMRDEHYSGIESVVFEGADSG